MHVLIGKLASTGSLKFSFFCGIRGYHEYRFRWVPTVNEMLHVELEPSNPHDGYAITIKKGYQGFFMNQWLDTYLGKFLGLHISLLFMAKGSPVESPSKVTFSSRRSGNSC